MKPVICCAVFLTAAVSFADKVYLKSGSVLSGTAGAAANGEITFKSDDLGDVKIKLENIVRLENAGEHVLQYKDLAEEKKQLSVTNGQYVADAKPVDMTNVKAIDPVPETWHGNIAVAYQSARGNTYQNSASVIANLNRRWEKDRFTADFGYYYSETGSKGQDVQKTTDRWEIEAKHDHFWWEKVYHYEDLKFDRDVIQLLNARYRAGLGGGYQWLDKTEFESTGKWSFNQELGANWVKEDYENNDNAKKSGYCALRYAHHFQYIPKWVEGLELFHNAEILPDVAEWDKFLAKCDVGLSTMIIWNINLLAKVEFDYDSKPAQDRRKDDIRYIVGLGYKW